jgi:hypothetical protein
MGIVYESRENGVFTCCQVALDIVKTNEGGINQPLLAAISS